MKVGKSHFINTPLNGSITIFLALSLTLIISVIFSTLESGRRLAVSSYLEGVTAMCMDSMFSDYCSQLWEEYHVFAVVSDNEDFTQNLSTYISKNLKLKDNLLEPGNSFLKSELISVTINDVSNLTDSYGEAFIHQVLSYMQYMEITNIAEYLLSDSEIEYDPTELGKLAEDNLSTDSFEALDFGPLIDMVNTSNKNLVDKNYETDIDLSETFTTDTLKCISHIFNEMLVHYLVESPSNLSSKMADTTDVPTAYTDLTTNPPSATYQPLDKFLFCEYVVNSFSSYTTQINDFCLDYQLEYLLCGYREDEINVIEAAREMILLRFGFNVAHILTDKEKMNTVASIAETTAIIPALPIIVETLLISLWALSESVIDVRDLLAGEYIPLIKTAEDWTLSIENILDFDYETESKDSGAVGLSYNNYLEMLLFTRDTHLLAFRTLDLIQLDITSNINDTFSITNCIIGASCEFRYQSKDIFSSANFYHNTYFAPRYTFTHNYYYY